MLICPYCGEDPPNPRLKLHRLKTTEIKHGIRINEGVIYCEECSRFYTIRDEILFMSRDDLRDKNKELDFLKKWQDELPKYIYSESKPYNLNSD